MVIRKFIKEDLPQVLDLCREVRQHHRDILGGYFTEQDDEFEQLDFLQSLEDDKMIALVAADCNKVYGYLLAKRKFAPYLVKNNVVHISNLGVKQEKRSQGIGKKLMDALLEMCREWNTDEIKLEVFNKNVGAYKFYERYGFEPLKQQVTLKMKKE